MASINVGRVQGASIWSGEYESFGGVVIDVGTSSIKPLVNDLVIIESSTPPTAKKVGDVYKITRLINSTNPYQCYIESTPLFSLGGGSSEIPSIDITSIVDGQPLTTEQLEIIKNNNIIRFYSDSLGYDCTTLKVITPAMNVTNPNVVSFSILSDALEAELDTFTIDLSTGAFGGKVKKIAQDVNLDSDKLQLYTGDAQIGNGVSKSQMQSWLNSQEKLISGTNIKTINNQSLLGSGNITIGGGSTNINVVDLGNLEAAGGTLTHELTNKIFALAGTPAMFVGAFEGMRFTTSNVVLNSSTTLNILLFAYGSRFITMALTRSSGAYTITQTNS